MTRNSGRHAIPHAEPNANHPAPGAPATPAPLVVAQELLNQIQDSRVSTEATTQLLKKGIARLQIAVTRGLYLANLARCTQNDQGGRTLTSIAHWSTERADKLNEILSQTIALVDTLATKIDTARDWTDQEVHTAADRLRWAQDLVSRLEAK
jgi:hypothetical protein